MSASLATSDGGDSPQADQNRQVVNRFFTALTEGRYRDAEEQVMPEATWWMLAKRECIDAVVWLAGFAKAFPDGLMFELEDSTSEGSRIAVRALARRRVPPVLAASRSASWKRSDGIWHLDL